MQPAPGRAFAFAQRWQRVLRIVRAASLSQHLQCRKMARAPSASRVCKRRTYSIIWRQWHSCRPGYQAHFQAGRPAQPSSEHGLAACRAHGINNRAAAGRLQLRDMKPPDPGVVAGRQRGSLHHVWPFRCRNAPPVRTAGEAALQSSFFVAICPDAQCIVTQPPGGLETGCAMAGQGPFSRCSRRGPKQLHSQQAECPRAQKKKKLISSRPDLRQPPTHSARSLPECIQAHCAGARLNRATFPYRLRQSCCANLHGKWAAEGWTGNRTKFAPGASNRATVCARMGFEAGNCLCQYSSARV